MSLTLDKWLDIVVLLIMALAVWRGWSQGMVMKLAQLGTVIAACIIAGILAGMFKGKLGSGLILPVFQEKMPLSGIWEREIASAADNFAWGIVYFVSFLAALLAFRHLIKVFNVVGHIPVIGTLNRLLGAMIGFTVAFILLYVAGSLVFRMIPQATTEEWGLTEEIIEKTYLFKVFVSGYHYE